MSINVPWLEVLKACYPNAQVIMVTMMIIMVVMLMIYGDDHYGGGDHGGIDHGGDDRGGNDHDHGDDHYGGGDHDDDIISFFYEQMSEDTEVLVVSPQYNADIAVIMVITNISNVKRVFFSFIFHFRAQRTVGL